MRFSTRLLITMIAVVVLAVAGVGGLWIGDEYAKFRKHAASLRDTFLRERRALVREEVRRAVDMIDYERQMSRRRLEEMLRTQVNVAHDVAVRIRDANQGKLKPQEVRSRMIEALRAIRFNDGRGYMFATDLDGVALLWTVRPHMEGTNVLDVRDSEGRAYFQNMIAIARGETGEGFVRYRMPKPGGGDKDYAKLSYIKHIDGEDWYIGAGEYLDDFEAQTQQQILDELSRIETEHVTEIFAGTWDGLSLCGPAKGRNMIDATDRNGVKIVRQLIAKAKRGDGGFLRYTMPDAVDRPAEPKISYVEGIPDWRWYVGAGVYIGQIERTLALQEEQLKANIRDEILHCLLMLLLVSAIVLVLGQRLTRQVNRALWQFGGFLRRAATESTLADPDTFRFTEIRDLAHSANAMIASRTAAERSLRASEENLRITLDSIVEGVIATDQAGNVVRMNPAAEQIAGVSTENAAGRPLGELLALQSDDDRREPIDLVGRTLADGQRVDIADHAILPQPDGAVHRIAATSAPIRDANDAIVGAVVVLRDVTDQHALQEQLRHGQKMEAIGRLAGGVAHDFNNVLTGIIGAAEMLNASEAFSTEDDRTKIEMILSASQRAAELNRQLLAFSRKAPAHRAPLEVSAAIDHTIAILRHTLDRRIRVESHVQPGLCVKANAGQLESALLNLAVNARDAMPEGGVIRFEARRVKKALHPDLADLPSLADQSQVHIKVLDTGCGMDEQTLTHIFEPFFTTKGNEGTGLGLAAVYGTIHDHGGSIEVTSTPGEGTCFDIFLPACEHAGRVMPTPGPTRDITQPTARPADNHQVLVVDDEPAVRQVTCDMLTRMGYEPTEAEGGRQAIELVKAAPDRFALMLMDMVMPGMSGAEALEEVRAIAPHIRVIIMSGYTRDSQAVALIEQGSYPLLNKPFRYEELSKMLDHVLQRAPATN